MPALEGGGAAAPRPVGVRRGRPLVLRLRGRRGQLRGVLPHLRGEQAAGLALVLNSDANAYRLVTNLSQ